MPVTPNNQGGQKLGEIYVDVMARLDHFEAKIDQISRDADAQGEKIGRRIESGFTKGARDMAKKAAAIYASVIASFAAVQKAIDIAIQAKNVARDADEIQSKFDVVFGNMRDQTSKWAEEFGSAVGRANQDVKRWLGTLQDTFVPLGVARSQARDMSQALVALGVDVASFNNAVDDDVISNFASAIVGNHDAVRGYGIVINEATLSQEALNQGIKKQFKDLTDLEKVQLRYNILLNATADAQGDAERTADSLANIEKRREAVLTNLLETQGKRLIPFFKDYNLAQIAILETIREMVQGVRDQVKEFDALKSRITSQESEISSLKDRYEELTANSQRSAVEQEELNRVIERLAFLVPSAVTAVDNYGKALGISTQAVDRFLNRQRALLRATQADVFEDLQDDLNAAINGFLRAQDSIDRFNSNIAKANEEGDKMVEVAESIGSGVTITSQKLSRASDRIRGYERGLADAVGKAGDFSDEINGLLPLLENFVDIENATPESISKELGLSAEAAELLAARLPKVVEELKNVNAAAAAGSAAPGAAPLPPAQRPTIPVEIAPDVDSAQDELDEFLTAQAQFYNELRFQAAGYLQFRLTQLDLELAELRRQGLSSVDIQQLKVERLKQIESDYTEFLKSQNQTRLTDTQQVLQDIVEEQTTRADVIRTTYDTLEQGFNDAFAFMRVTASESASAFEKGVIAFGNTFISTVNRMIAKWLAFQALKSVFGGFLPIPFGAQGGNFVGTPQGVKRANRGADFIVPPGFRNDTFPLLVQSGERVTVTSQTGTNIREDKLTQVVGRLDAIILNSQTQEQDVSLTIEGEVETQGDTIVTVYETAKSQSNRFR